MLGGEERPELDGEEQPELGGDEQPEWEQHGVHVTQGVEDVEMDGDVKENSGNGEYYAVYASHGLLGDVH